MSKYPHTINDPDPTLEWCALDETDDTPPEKVLDNVIRELQSMHTIPEFMQGYADRLMQIALHLRKAVDTKNDG